MAISWLLCECYIKYQNKTDQFISSEYLDKFVLIKLFLKSAIHIEYLFINKENLKKKNLKIFLFFWININRNINIINKDVTITTIKLAVKDLTISNIFKLA